MNIQQAKLKIKDFVYDLDNSNTIQYLHQDGSQCIFEYAKLYNLSTREVINKKTDYNEWVYLVTEHNGNLLLHLQDLCWIKFITTKTIYWIENNNELY